MQIFVVLFHFQTKILIDNLKKCQNIYQNPFGIQIIVKSLLYIIFAIMFPFCFIGTDLENNRVIFFSNQHLMPTFYPTTMPTDFMRQHCRQNQENRQQLQKNNSNLPTTKQEEPLLGTEQPFEKKQQDFDNLHNVEQKNKANQNKPKKPRAKNSSKASDEYYKPFIPTQMCYERHVRKNVQSNILGQIFSYATHDTKSKGLLDKFYKGDKHKVSMFYQFIKILKKGNRKFISKKYLIDICHFGPGHIGYKTIVKNQKILRFLSIEEFRSGFRFLVNFYLLKLAYPAILTSSKMRKQNWMQHFKKCREIRKLVFQDRTDNQQIGPEQLESQYDNFQILAIRNSAHKKNEEKIQIADVNVNANVNATENANSSDVEVKLEEQ